MDIRDEVLDELLAGYEKPEDLLGDDGLLKRLKKALIERALGAELTAHLGYEKGDPAGRGTGNIRNGYSRKTLKTDDGDLRDRGSAGSPGELRAAVGAEGRDPLRRFRRPDRQLYARGMTVREIQGHLQELYGVEVSPDLISRVTDAVLEEVREWQNRPLDPVYPVVFFDALQGQNPRRRPGPQQGGLCRAGARCRRREARARALDRTDRRREVLAQGDERAEDPRRRRYPDRRRRRPQGLPRGDRRRLPGDDGPDLHRPSDPQLARLRQLEGPQDDHAVDSRDLSRRDRGCWRAPGSTTSRPNGDGAIRRSARPGGGTGSTSCRSSPSRRRSAR